MSATNIFFSSDDISTLFSNTPSSMIFFCPPRNYSIIMNVPLSSERLIFQNLGHSCLRAIFEPTTQDLNVAGSSHEYSNQSENTPRGFLQLSDHLL